MDQQPIAPGAVVEGFVTERVEEIPELRSRALIFRHEKNGARLVHLYNDDPNNLFCIAFRTPVFNHTGVPHILEHSVLCGSRKFPLKDPFLELLKGSLQTFLNALTYPDKTVYPVSSQVERDFYNLVDVYCDAVFHPRLSEHTFSQEGWHFDCENPDAPLSIKGIVYNEMKGVFSDFSSHVARRTLAALYPDTTYAFESGGDPDYITDLTWDEFRRFHRRYYHPSNSYIFLYGNLPTRKTLAFLHKKYLGEFSALAVDSHIEPQPLWNGERRIEFDAPSRREDDGTATVSVCWLLGNTADPLVSFMGRILSRYLLGTESSPLKRALIDSGLGEDLCEVAGLELDLVQSMFAAGLKKTRSEHAERIREIIYDTLRRQVETGMDDDLLEGAIRQLEFRLREITSGGHFPYNLQLADRCLQSWLYDGDPLSLLRFEAPLERIKAEKKKGTGFFESFLRERLLENTHCLLATVKASHALSERLERRTEEQARRLTGSFTEDQKNECRAMTASLLDEQKAPPSPEALATLPRLNKNDLPPRNREVDLTTDMIDGTALYACDIFTSGVVYLDIGFDCSAIPGPLLQYLPLYSELLRKAGAGSLGYEQMAKRIALATGGVGSSVMCERHAGGGEKPVFRFFLHGKALVDRHAEMTGIFTDLLTRPVLDNEKQVRDLLLEMRADLNSSVVGSGHHFAVRHAAAALSHTRFIDEQLDGISQLRFLDACVREDRMTETLEALRQLHACIITRRDCVVSVTADCTQNARPGIRAILDALPAGEKGAGESQIGSREDRKQITGIEVGSSVNYTARAWRVASLNPRGLGQLFLLARILSTGYLWNKVRVEGGAYGGMAMLSTAHGDFCCASYRDPNLRTTLGHFESGLRMAADGLPVENVDQSIVGAIGRLDGPKSPHEKGLGETLHLICGRTRQHRQELREGVLKATPGEVAEAARHILEQPRTATTLLGSASAFDAAAKEGMSMVREKLLESGARDIG